MTGGRHSLLSSVQLWEYVQQVAPDVRSRVISTCTRGERIVVFESCTSYSTWPATAPNTVPVGLGCSVLFHARSVRVCNLNVSELTIQYSPRPLNVYLRPSSVWMCGSPQKKTKIVTKPDQHTCTNDVN